MWISKKEFDYLIVRLDEVSTQLSSLEDKVNTILLDTAKTTPIILKMDEAIMPVFNIPESTKFVPQDKKLFIEEEKEYTNLYI